MLKRIFLLALALSMLFTVNFAGKDEINLYEEKNRYYAFDLEGEKFLAKLDEKLYLAENHASSYIKNKEYLSSEKQDFSEIEIEKELSKIYYKNVLSLLEELKIEYKSLEIKEFKAKQYQDYDYLELELDIGLEDYENESLKVKVKVYSELYKVYKEGKLLNANRIKIKRYKVEAWQKN